MAGIELTDLPYLIIGTFAELRERSEKLAKGLVNKGKGVAPEAGKRAAKGKESREILKERGMHLSDELTETIGNTVEKALGQMGLITKSDIEALDKKLASLERKMAKKAREESEEAK
ncbi:MAG: phasin family protein [Actinomycetota bacterium]|nr:phasin family protein [Actinomycetota bacterium]